MTRALIVIDVQAGFDDHAYWGIRTNPKAEANVGALMAAWRQASQPIVRVIHHSADPDSPLHPSRPGSAVKPEAGGSADVEVVKSVHSSFHGDPDLACWLRHQNIESVAICGITTNMCCETTARVASDLGFDTWFVIDATAAFDLIGPDGSVITGAQLTRATHAVLSADFCVVMKTAVAVDRILSAPRAETPVPGSLTG